MITVADVESIQQTMDAMDAADGELVPKIARIMLSDIKELLAEVDRLKAALAETERANNETRSKNEVLMEAFQALKA